MLVANIMTCGALSACAGILEQHFTHSLEEFSNAQRDHEVISSR